MVKKKSRKKIKKVSSRSDVSKLGNSRVVDTEINKMSETKKDEGSDSGDVKSSKKIKSKFDKKENKKRSIRQIFSEFLVKAGSESSPYQVNRLVIIFSLIFCGLLSVALIITGIVLGSWFSHLLLVLLSIWTVILIGVYLISLLFVFFYFDYKIYQRTKEIEDVLPEFLQLTSANISAGMTIDRALWFAVRPKFGVLAKEIEEVAKFTIAGDDLEKALLDFANKYDSDSLKEAMNLLIEGMRAGGEIGYLLNQISSNMQDIRLMKQEISSSVTTYVIFITVAAIIGAPLLLALSGQLLVIISSLTTGLDTGGSSSSFFSLDLSGDSISLEDFRIFSLVMLFFSSFFSSLIIGVIRKGSPKEGLKFIPAYLAVSYVLYFAAAILFSLLLGGLF
ncbi:type II secretion system F family protein [Candidatus Woesearchaeota archaeon]|nr:type II secretion system F family protein [Candidatus Woesearchaeota archaeon]